jgi:thiol-disulfide isomerase/thioredoxin
VPQNLKLRTGSWVPPGIIPVTVLLLMIVVWFAFPLSFVRGVLVGFAAALALVLGGIFFASRKVRTTLGTRLAPPPLPHGRWDYAMTAENLEGVITDFSQFAGEVLVLNFWGTSCAPCVAEMPSFARLRDATADLPVRVACVTAEPADVVRRFARRYGLDAPVFILSHRVPEVFATRAIPATYVVDTQGNIALRHVRAAEWDAPSVVSFIRGLAAVPADAEGLSNKGLNLTGRTGRSDGCSACTSQPPVGMLVPQVKPKVVRKRQ